MLAAYADAGLRFIPRVGPLPGAPRTIVVGGGSGYKMASVLGEVAAELVTTGRSALDLTLFAPDRFS